MRKLTPSPSLATSSADFILNPAIPHPAIPDPAIADLDRYSRQILFPGIGAAGQQRLARSHVAIIGCGATGAATASLLARAGVGTLTLIDRDVVEPSNLQRQILFDEADALESLPKAEAARRKIALFNSSITVHARIADLVPANIHELLGPPPLAPELPATKPPAPDPLAPTASTSPPIDLILDATDNFETRYLLNDYAVRHSVPWIYAGAIGASATTMNILPAPSEHRTACLACIFPHPPAGPIETCDTAGILSTAVNLAASLQATEALKLLTGQPHLMRRTLLSFDLWNPDLWNPDLWSPNRPNPHPPNPASASPASPTPPPSPPERSGYLTHSEISTAHPRPGCTVCGDRIFTHLAGEGRPHITLCGRNSVQIHERHRPIDLLLLRDRLAAQPDLHDLRANTLLLRFRRGDQTFTLFADGRAIVAGTTDISLARSLYARYVGS